MYRSQRGYTLREFRVKIKLYAFVLFQIFFFVPSLGAVDIATPKISMFAKASFEEEKRNFSVYDKIYVVLDFPTIPVGTHAISADWVTPWGNLNRQDVHHFSLTEEAKRYRVFFWLKLKRKSALQRTLTGSDFTDEYFGDWQIRLFINGKTLEKQRFTVN